MHKKYTEKDKELMKKLGYPSLAKMMYIDPVAQERERILDKIDRLTKDIIRNEAQEMSDAYIAKMSLIQDIEDIINDKAN